MDEEGPHQNWAPQVGKTSCPLCLKQGRVASIYGHNFQVKGPHRVFKYIQEAHCEWEFGSLKSYDFHILLQIVIPLVMRGLLHPTVRAAIMRLGTMFKYLTAKVVNAGDM